MSNLIYDGYIDAALKAEVAWLADNIRVLLVDVPAYTANKNHNFLSDVPSGAIISTSANLTGKSVSGGVLRAADAVFESVGGSVTGKALVVYKHTGNAATSRLICYIDSGSGLPVTPNGSNVRAVWPSSGILSI